MWPLRSVKIEDGRPRLSRVVSGEEELGGDHGLLHNLRNVSERKLGVKCLFFCLRPSDSIYPLTPKWDPSG